MKKTQQRLLIILVTLLILVTSTACKEDSDSPLSSFSFIREPVDMGPANAIAIVVQATENSADPELFLRQKDIIDLISSWATPESSCVFISVSGESIVVDTFNVPESDAVDDNQVADDRAYWANKIIDIASEITANANEVDTLTALIKAGNWLRDKNNENKYILYIGSGIATQNELFTFTNPGLISTEPKQIIDQLNTRYSLPYLDGVTVWFAGLGCTVRPQEPVGTNMNSIRKLYETLVIHSGGNFKQIYAELGGKSAQSDFSVTPVSFPSELPLVFMPSEPIRAEAFTKPQMITEEQVRFIGDSADYVDEAAALTVLSPIADYMIATPSFNLLLIGTTAGDENSQVSQRLSEDRANTVKNTLVSLGVPSDRIFTLGLGSVDPWHIYGLGTTSSEAAQNRKVVLISADSPDASTFMHNIR